MTHEEHQASLVLANIHQKLNPEAYDVAQGTAAWAVIKSFVALAKTQGFTVSEGEHQQWAIIFPIRRITYSVRQDGHLMVNVLLSGQVQSLPVPLHFDPVRNALYSTDIDQTVAPTPGSPLPTLPPLVVLAKATEMALTLP